MEYGKLKNKPKWLKKKVKIRKKTRFIIINK